MSGILNAALGVVVLIVLVWVLVFGALGAVLAARRGGSPLAGFASGVLIGPLCWVPILWLTRRAKSVTADEWIEDEPAISTTPAAGIDLPRSEPAPGGHVF